MQCDIGANRARGSDDDAKEDVHADDGQIHGRRRLAVQRPRHNQTGGKACRDSKRSADEATIIT